MRKKLADKGDTIFGIPVYVVKTDDELDASKGLVVLRDSFDLIKTKSPFLVESMKQAFESIIIYDKGPRFKYFQTDKCLVMNASALPRIGKDKLKVSSACQMISIATSGNLMRGRHGYSGIRYVKILRNRAAIRFVYRCINEENHLYLLSLLNVMNKDINELRPDRRYYERFLRQDMQSLSFGKKLAVAADGLRIIESETSDLKIEANEE
jgi:hypothetical protein